LSAHCATASRLRLQFLMSPAVLLQTATRSPRQLFPHRQIPSYCRGDRPISIHLQSHQLQEHLAGDILFHNPIIPLLRPTPAPEALPFLPAILPPLLVLLFFLTHCDERSSQSRLRFQLPDLAGKFHFLNRRRRENSSRLSARHLPLMVLSSRSTPPLSTMCSLSLVSPKPPARRRYDRKSR
jgi:hypothetical protein